MWCSIILFFNSVNFGFSSIFKKTDWRLHYIVTLSQCLKEILKVKIQNLSKNLKNKISNDRKKKNEIFYNNKKHSYERIVFVQINHWLHSVISRYPAIIFAFTFEIRLLEFQINFYFSYFLVLILRQRNIN